MHKLRVGVLMGGKSEEREVSFNSGRTVCDHLDTAWYDVVPLFQTRDNRLFILPLRFLHRGKTSDFEHRLTGQATEISWDDLKKLVDIIYIAMHGRYAEDGTIQGFLEVLNIPYVGSKVFASAVGMNKLFQKDILASHGISVPKDVRVNPVDLDNNDLVNTVLKEMRHKGIEFPCIVKPAQEGSSLGTSRVRSADELLSAIKKAALVHPTLRQSVLIEPKIEGMEFACILLTDYKNNSILPLPPTEVVADTEVGFFDYEQKYMPGRSVQFTPARCSQQQINVIQQTCMRVMKLLEFTNVARIDGFLTSDGDVVIIDPNSFSGAGPASFLFKQAAEINMSHTHLINYLIETELCHYGMLDAMIKNNEQLNHTTNQSKIRVAVLLGGTSHEKEISLESGRNITFKLSPHKYEAIPLFVNHAKELYRLDQRLLVSTSTSEIEQKITSALKINWHDLPSIADFIFIGLHGGEGENGSVQGTLEVLGLPYNGSSVLTSALCMNKAKTNQFLLSQGFDVPQGLLISVHDWIANNQTVLHEITRMLPFPLIVKPHDDGCSFLVQKVTNLDQLSNALNTLFATDKQHALIEECVRGMELTVGVIGNDEVRVLPPSQAVTTSDILSIEEKFLPGAGENQTPAPLPAEALALISSTIEAVYKKINAKGYARIDCFYQSAEQSPTKQPRVVILEINTLPGMTPATVLFHQAAEIGLKPMDMIDLIINFGFEQHQKIDRHAESITLVQPKSV